MQIKENKDTRIAQKEESEKKIIKKKDIKNLVKDVEYTSVDQKGNRFNLLANFNTGNLNHKLNL